jgi:hypothetical protein
MYVFYPSIYTKDGNTAPSVTCYHLNAAAKASRLTFKNRCSSRFITFYSSSPVSNKYHKNNETI